MYHICLDCRGLEELFHKKKTWLFIVMYPMRVSCFKLSNSVDSKYQRENRLGIQQPAGSPNKLVVSVLSLQFLPLIIP